MKGNVTEMDTTPQEVTQTETVVPAETETVAALPTPEDYAKLQAALKDANKEAASRRKKLDAFEKAEADRKAAEMSDLEKAQAEIARYQQEALQANKAAIAARHGLPETWVKRIQGATIEEMEADAAELAASIPTKQQTTPAISSTAPATQAALTPEAIRKMSHEQINANWENIQRTLANQK
jgi:hypothetical protein